MKYISDFREGEHVSGVYLCKQKTPAITRNGKPYDNVTLQDRTGMIDSKIWDPNSPAISDFEALDFVEIMGEVTNFMGSLQLNIRRIRVAQAGTFDPSDYVPCTTRDVGEMKKELHDFIASVGNPYLNTLLRSFFEDESLLEAFASQSAAKTLHHAFIGGLLEHTLSVARFCEYMVSAYPILKRDLLITVALLHDIGKVKELSPFPLNDYTDVGQLIGHIVIGAQMIQNEIQKIDGFPTILGNEVVHCILSHHGELEYGSPKKPAMPEAVALNLADNADAKMEALWEIYDADHGRRDWLGYNRMFDTNMRRTDEV